MQKNTTIVLREDTVSIAVEAFHGCKNLVSVTLPDGIKEIDYVFIDCVNLAEINIPNSVMFIKHFAFDNTAWYNNQPDGVIYAGKVAYRYKGDIPINAHIVIRDGTLAIANEAFYYNAGYRNIVSIEIPDSVINILGIINCDIIRC